jgi:hypothetical protein
MPNICGGHILTNNKRHDPAVYVPHSLNLSFLMFVSNSSVLIITGWWGSLPSDVRRSGPESDHITTFAWKNWGKLQSEQLVMCSCLVNGTSEMPPHMTHGTPKNQVNSEVHSKLDCDIRMAIRNHIFFPECVFLIWMLNSVSTITSYILYCSFWIPDFWCP